MDEIAPDAVVSDGPDDSRITHWLHENGLSLQFQIAERDDESGDFSYEGWINFDGCINWRTDPDCYAHACEPEDTDRLKRAFQAIKSIAAERVRSWCG